MDLAWGSSANAVSYSVVYGTASGVYGTTASANATSPYTVTGLTNGTVYYFMVVATGSNGSSLNASAESSATPVAAGSPTAPSALSASTVSTAQIDLTWTDNSGNETGFELERSTSSGAGFAQINAPAANATSYSSAGLTLNTTYYYRIRAVNGIGNSAYSAEASATTLPGVPTGPAAAANGSGQIDLSWTAPAGGTAAITSYSVKRGTASGGPYVTIASPATNSYSDTTAVNGTVYYYVIAANNAGGSSANSAEVTASALATPTAMSATAASTTQLNTSWTDNSSNETGFELERSTTSGAGFAQITTPAANATSYNNAGLTVNTTYYYRIRAVNASGYSAYSSEGSQTTLPAAPTLPSATTSTSAQIDLSWTASAGGTAAITGYTIKRGTASGGPYGTTVATVAGTSYSDTTVVNGTVYYYVIVANNAGGSSANSTEVTASSLAAPSGVTATAASTTQLNVSWTDNSSNETGFELERSTTSGAGFAQITTPAANATSYNNSGLTVNTTYYYRIRAVNAAGSSVYSAEGSQTTLPAAPTLPTASVSGSAQVDLSWTASAGGTAAITGYTILRGTASGGPYGTTVATVAGTSYSDTTVANGTTYYYVIVANNAGGSSANSAEVSGSPMATPSALSASTASTTQLNTSWLDNSTNETGFELERSTTSGAGFAQITTPAANATSYNNSGLTVNTTYYYRIRAVNATGYSAYSAEGNQTTLPAAPTLPSASTSTSSQIDLSWTASAGGTAAITGYTILRGTAAGGPYGTTVATVAGTSYSDTSLTNATTYYYVIVANNAGGSSANSSEVSATPIAAPSGLAVAYSSDTQNNLSWTDNSSNETGFKIERSTTSGAGFAQIGTAAANATTYNDTTAVAGNLYYYRVRANSATADSSYTSQATIPAPTITTASYQAGTAAGGTVVSISGTGFRASSVLKINGTTVTPSVVTSTSMTFTTPSAASVGATSIGAYDLVAYNPDTQTGTLTAGFTFVGSPRLWLRSDVGVLNAGGTAAANGDAVATWTDQSGNGRSATQGTNADRPIFATSQFNGKPGLTFDGAVTWMNMIATSANIANGLSAVTICSAHTFANTTGKSERIFQISTSTSVNVTRFNLAKASASGSYTVSYRDGTDAGGSLSSVTTGANNTNIHVSSATLDFGASNPRFRSYFDGSASNTQNTTSTTAFDATDSLSVTLGRLGTTVNATFAFEGKLAEILFYGSALSLTDRQAVDDYLTHKYGI